MILKFVLGIIVITFYMVHSAFLIATDQHYHMLWTCHIGCLLMGMGLLVEKPKIHAIGFLWVISGVPLWIMNMISVVDAQPTSFLTHIGGMFIGFAGVRLLGIPRLSWANSLVAIIIFAQLTSFITPPLDNINLMFGVWKGWGSVFPTASVYYFSIFSYCFTLFYGIEFLLRKFWVKDEFA